MRHLSRSPEAKKRFKAFKRTLLKFVTWYSGIYMYSRMPGTCRIFGAPAGGSYVTRLRRVLRATTCLPLVLRRARNRRRSPD